MENNEPIAPEDAVAVAQNPDAEADETKILEKMKGDSIGDTLFSERFVLKTILKLSELQSPVSEDEAFEKDLCNLWDMTVDKDVVNFLMEKEALDLFTTIIQNTDDDRLIEILIGIIGNLCCSPEVVNQLLENEDVITSLLETVQSTDALILVQYMRLLGALFSQVR
jgi:hypothetical protein